MWRAREAGEKSIKVGGCVMKMARLKSDVIETFHFEREIRMKEQKLANEKDHRGLQQRYKGPNVCNWNFSFFVCKRENIFNIQKNFLREWLHFSHVDYDEESVFGECEAEGIRV